MPISRPTFAELLKASKQHQAQMRGAGIDPPTAPHSERVKAMMERATQRRSTGIPSANIHATADISATENGIRIKIEEEEVDWKLLPMFVAFPAALEKSKQASSVSIQGPLKTFMCFSKLPFELQLMVWETARPAPRVIKPIKSKDGVGWLYYWVASRWYQLRLKSFRSSLFAKPRIFFDVERDFYYTHFVGTSGDAIDDAAQICNIAAETLHPDYIVSFFGVEVWYRQVKQIMVVDAEKRMDRAWGEVAEFRADLTPFEWQGSKSLTEIRAEDMVKNDLHKSINWTAEKIWKVGFVANERDLSVEKA